MYAPHPEDWEITSEVMMSHQRGGEFANKLIEDYLLNEYRKPKDFESFLYMNLVLQGDAIKTAIEAHRRDMPYCMGTLFGNIMIAGRLLRGRAVITTDVGKRNIILPRQLFGTCLYLP